MYLGIQRGRPGGSLSVCLSSVNMRIGPLWRVAGYCGAEWTDMEQLSSFTSELWPVLRTQVVAKGPDPGLSSRPPSRSHRSIFWALDPLWF